MLVKDLDTVIEFLNLVNLDPETFGISNDPVFFRRFVLIIVIMYIGIFQE